MKPRMKWTAPWRFQLWGPIPGHYAHTEVVWHSPWRARLRFCKCIHCSLKQPKEKV